MLFFEVLKEFEKAGSGVFIDSTITIEQEHGKGKLSGLPFTHQNLFSLNLKVDLIASKIPPCEDCVKRRSPFRLFKFLVINT